MKTERNAVLACLAQTLGVESAQQVAVSVLVSAICLYHLTLREGSFQG